jgi:CheY-like chemotaxis protein
MMKNNARPTVLVVEDFDYIRLLMRQVLEMKGYHVVEAVNGWEAVEFATREHPHLILMDINLPILDGTTATEIIREHEELQNVPIVIITAHDSADFRADAVEAGCTEYLTKPFDIDQLQTILTSLVHSVPNPALS